MASMRFRMAEDATIGSVVAGCRVVEPIGRGGMGVVYLAEQVSLGRRVALKLLTRELAGDPGFRERFQAEARVAASLDHPNVVPIYAAGESDGELYIVMRWVAGGDLRGLLRDGPVAPERAASLTAQVASALDAAHARGLVHRDVKAANVLLSDDGETAYLTDFGLTKAAATTSGLTRTGQWLGTLDACAPEQIEGRRVDARTDVYALGCLLFQLLTGSVPYPRDHDAAKVWAHVNAPVPAPSELVPTLDRRWDEVIARALAKAPEDRFASAGGLGRAALAVAAGEPFSERDDDRSVATGPAAPGPDDETIAFPAQARDDADATLAPTAVAGRAAAAPARTAVAGPRGARHELRQPAHRGGGETDAAHGGSGRRRALAGVLAAVAALLVGGGVAALALSGGGDDDGAAETVVRTVRRAVQRRPARTVEQPAADPGSARQVADTGGSGGPGGPGGPVDAGRGGARARGPPSRAQEPRNPPPAHGTPTAYAPFSGADYAVDVPSGWANVATDHQESVSPPRYRSQWSDNGCGCSLVVDWMPGYGRSGLDNARETPGGTVVPTTIAGFGDVALRTASSGDLHTATYFIAYAGGNYAVRAEARSPEAALEIASRTTASLAPHGE